MSSRLSKVSGGRCLKLAENGEKKEEAMVDPAVGLTITGYREILVFPNFQGDLFIDKSY
jgi:hypothetical protein